MPKGYCKIKPQYSSPFILARFLFIELHRFYRREYEKNRCNITCSLTDISSGKWFSFGQKKLNPIKTPIVKRLAASNVLMVSSEKVKEQEAELQANLDEALKYLNSHPSQVSDHFKLKDYSNLKQLIQKDNFQNFRDYRNQFEEPSRFTQYENKFSRLRDNNGGTRSLS